MLDGHDEHSRKLFNAVNTALEGLEDYDTAFCFTVLAIVTAVSIARRCKNLSMEKAEQLLRIFNAELEKRDHWNLLFAKAEEEVTRGKRH